MLYDKFELDSQKLKLKGVLGSGAYGIVRLASFQDEFGVMTNVAVKMMKGITEQRYNTYIRRNIYIKSKKYIKFLYTYISNDVKCIRMCTCRTQSYSFT